MDEQIYALDNNKEPLINIRYGVYQVIDEKFIHFLNDKLDVKFSNFAYRQKDGTSFFNNSAIFCDGTVCKTYTIEKEKKEDFKKEVKNLKLNDSYINRKIPYSDTFIYFEKENILFILNVLADDRIYYEHFITIFREDEQLNEYDKEVSSEIDKLGNYDFLDLDNTHNIFYSEKGIVFISKIKNPFFNQLNKGCEVVVVFLYLVMKYTSELSKTLTNNINDLKSVLKARENLLEFKIKSRNAVLKVGLIEFYKKLNTMFGKCSQVDENLELSREKFYIQNELNKIEDRKREKSFQKFVSITTILIAIFAFFLGFAGGCMDWQKFLGWEKLEIQKVINSKQVENLQK